MPDRQKPTLDYGTDEPKPRGERWALIIALVAAAYFIGRIASLFADAFSILALILIVVGIGMMVSSFLGPSRPVLLFCGGAFSTILGAWIWWFFWGDRKE